MEGLAAILILMPNYIDLVLEEGTMLAEIESFQKSNTPLFLKLQVLKLIHIYWIKINIFCYSTAV